MTRIILTVTLGLGAILLGLVAAVIILTSTAVEAAERYSAHDTLRRAQVGTFSSRPEVVPSVTRPSGDYERMDCFINPARRQPQAITCVRRK